MNQSKAVKFSRSLTSTVVGITAVAGALIDMQDFEGVIGILAVGAITDGATSLKAQGGNAADGSDLADLAGTNTVMAITDDGKIVTLDVYRPAFRYLKFVAVRGGATGAILDGIIAMQYGPRTLPTVQDATVAKSVLAISPVAGVA
jgi:hypothetical protein